MISLALKMFIGNRASCIGVIFGIFLATLLIAQQSAIFLGVVSRSYRLITDISQPNIWVMDPATESEDKLRRMPESYVDIVRSVPGVEWAVPLAISSAPIITTAGIFEIAKLYGVDEVTLIGAPIQMVEGDIRNLRREGAVIIDVFAAQGILASTLSDGTKVPLQVGDELEINNKRAIIVGLCKITRGFYPQPNIFTSYTEFQRFTGLINRISFIPTRTVAGANIEEVMQGINSHPGLLALTHNQFRDRIIRSFLRTGILINFGLSVALGVIIGFSIAGQIFYSMTLENLMYFALIKAVGGSRQIILKMIIFQALLAGIIGFLLGMGVTVLWGIAVRGTTLAFLLPWELILFTGVIILIICISTAWISVRKVLKTDPKVLMGT